MCRQRKAPRPTEDEIQRGKALLHTVLFGPAAGEGNPASKRLGLSGIRSDIYIAFLRSMTFESSQYCPADACRHLGSQSDSCSRCTLLSAGPLQFRSLVQIQRAVPACRARTVWWMASREGVAVPGFAETDACSEQTCFKEWQRCLALQLGPVPNYAGGHSICRLRVSAAAEPAHWKVGCLDAIIGTER